MKKKLIILLILLLFLTGCSKTIFEGSYKYDDSAYTFGNTTLTSESIKTINVEWLVGKIIIIKQNTNELIIKEQIDTTSENYKLGWKVINDTVDVKFMPSTDYLKNNFRIKDLYLYIPSYIEAINIKANKTNSIQGKDLNINTLSIEGYDTFIDLSNSNIDNLEIKTNSDYIFLMDNKIKKINIETTQSNIGLGVYNNLEELKIKTETGNISLYPKEDFDCTINFKTISGSFITNLNHKQENNNYIFNKGTNKFYIESTKGSVKVHNPI
ncbi:MAG: DUF4097 family beta strand repeat-containing protein [Bacilli bacterium]|nr:DUF4097 domain-containing protein [Acholeplasmataceae bacterium]MDY2902670.1 DUF4097 family beta strand repeat-containing protein [Bacilli bacterium]